MGETDRGEPLRLALGPSHAFKAVTLLAGIAVVVCTVAFVERIVSGTWQSWAGLLTIGLPVLVFVGVLRIWTHTEYAFDEKLGILEVKLQGPTRREERRELPFVLVSAIVDRRSSSERLIELVLTDRSSMLLARVPSSDSSALDRITRDLGRVLKMPVELGSGAVVADRFEIDSLVGRGGMGLVYRARDRKTCERVAVKFLSAPNERKASAQRFAREARLLASLDHPRIARYVAHGTTDDGHAYLAMEWLEGKDLRQVLSEGALSANESLAVVSGTAEALAKVHEQGIVHRDLKPSNLFLRGGSPDGLVLLDFGVARDVDNATLLTGTAGLIGTPYYMAPEQASSSRDIQATADVFSLGCIFYECLAGERAFDADQVLGVLARILYDNPRPLKSVNPSIPDEWSQLISSMLSKRESERPSNGSQLVHELKKLPPAGAVKAPRPSGPDSHEASDQVLVCVVLATPRPGTLVPESEGIRLDSIKSAMQRFGCPLERLADGSLLATVLPRQSATDQVRIAARCAMYLREQLDGARIAIATGRAPIGPNARVGDAVDRAARLVERTLDGEGIRLDEVTDGLLDVRFQKGTRNEIPLLLGEKLEWDETRPLLGKPTPCVGRELELIQLEGVLDSALTERESRAAVVMGPPGSGKSRLRHELLRRWRAEHPESVVLTGYGDPLSAGSPYVLVSDALRRYAGIRVGDEAARARELIQTELVKRLPESERKRVSEFLGELMGVPFPAEDSPPLAAARAEHGVMSEQIARAFTDFILAERAAHPVLFVLEDLQWGDALTIKLLEQALRRREPGAFFVFALGRPETEEIFPKLFADHRSVSLSLRPLKKEACAKLVLGVLGEDVEPEALKRILELSAGNALFLEEMIRSTAEGKTSDAPETVIAVLQARLSRIEPEARLTLRAASVLGETFWRSGVQRIAESWGKRDDVGAWLDTLVEMELVAPLPTSRFPSDQAYAFRHALVCDAGKGLVTNADRKTGHLTAGRWLEEVGETDGIILARHAVEGGDPERAIGFYVHAAERSIELYDFPEANARATKAMESGASGHTLGVAHAIRASALYSIGRWVESAEQGLLALPLLERGESYYCSTVESLLQVLPNTGDFASYGKLTSDITTLVPKPNARPAHLRAVCAQLLGHMVVGDHTRGAESLGVIDRLVTPAETNPAVRGYAQLFRAIYEHGLGTDTLRAFRLAEGACRDLEEAQVFYRKSLGLTVQSFCAWRLGDIQLGEKLARLAHATADQVHDNYHRALADWYLALSLSEASDPAKLDEADVASFTMLKENKGPVFESSAYGVASRVALGRRDWALAESRAKKSLEQPSILPFRALACASLLDALRECKRAKEAVELTRADLTEFEALKGAVFSGVIFRVAMAHAMFDAGESERGKAQLRSALAEIHVRVGLFHDAERERVFRSRPENVRASELERIHLS